MKIAGRGGLNDAYFLKNVAIMFIDLTADAFVYLYFLKNVFRYIVNSSGI